MLIPIPVKLIKLTTTYTANMEGAQFKTVNCENCSTEFLYKMKREASGVGTSFSGVNKQGAADGAVSGAKELLHAYLENDFDAVPCPSCGHYQRYMFPKLEEAKSWWLQVLLVLALLGGSFSAVGVVYWGVLIVLGERGQTITHVVMALSVLAVACLVVFGLRYLQRARTRRFNPNAGDPEARIKLGRELAISKADFEHLQKQQETEVPTQIMPAGFPLREGIPDES
jgi:hypothetical protein